MSQDVREVRVDIRHHTLATAATLRGSDDGEVFVALDDPPPVRCVLAVHEADARHALEVTRVVEVATDGSPAGVYGRFRDAEALEKFEKVGTEHLPPGEATTPPDEDGDHAGYLAMPAPVVDPDPSDRIDVNELRQLEDPPTEGEPGEAAAAEADTGNTDNDPETSDGDGNAGGGEESGDGSPRKGRKRRGRKRR